MYFAAAELAKEILTVDSDNHVWQRLHGFSLAKLRRFGEAEKILIHLAGEVPASEVTACTVGHLYKEWGQHAKAEEWFKRACDLAPNETAPWIYLGITLMHLERLPEAEQALRRALRADGDVDEAYLNLGNVRQLLGDLTDAQHCYEQALVIDPQYEAAQLRLADVVEVRRLRSHSANDSR